MPRTTPVTTYVFRMDRDPDPEPAPFSPLRPAIRFDASPPGTGAQDLVTHVLASIAAILVGLDERRVFGDVPHSLPPAEGLTTSGSLVTLWPHGALEDYAPISEFLPDGSDFAASRIAEPTALAALAVGMVGLGMFRYWRIAR